MFGRTDVILNVIRTSFLCEHTVSAEMKKWQELVVKPALRINCAVLPDHFQRIMMDFASCMASGNLSEKEIANLKVASAAVQGELSEHPIVIGLALQCRRQMEKRSRGILTMRGRRSNETDTEASMIADSGLQLALSACSPSLAKEFGLAASCLRISLQELHQHGLPAPALALQFPDVLRQNFDLADQRFPRTADMKKCSWAATKKLYGFVNSGRG